MKQWYVYLLECADSSLYCGISTEPERRVAQHNGLLPGGAKYTRGRRPVRLVELSVCTGQSEAIRLELAVKAAKRSRKRELLQGVNSLDAPSPQA